MKITDARFAGSSTRVAQKPSPKMPEFAFIGRSNVGKSSLINMLCDNSKLAMTSSTPGKTRLINHFAINKEWYLVDLPGYGFAKMSKAGKDQLTAVIKDYIFNSEEMVLLFVLIDSRHDIGKIDLDFLIDLGENGIPFSIIYTKSDKQGPNVTNAQIERNCALLKEYWEELPPYFVSSAQKGTGKESILNHINTILESLKS